MSNSSESKKEPSSQFILNYPEEESISEHLLDFFCAELIYARMKDKDPNSLWLISPWITESKFSFSSRGCFADLFPGYSRGTIYFSEILNKFLEYGTEINFVCYPPHKLVDIKQIYKYHDSLCKINSICKSNKENKTETEDDKQNLIEEIINNSRKELSSAREKAKGKSYVISFIRKIEQNAPPEAKINIYYNERLHAKIILGKNAALFGSANLTHSGFNWNDELLSYETNPVILDRMLKVAGKLSNSEYKDNKKNNNDNSSEEKNNGNIWKLASDKYSAKEKFEQIIGHAKLEKIISSEQLPSEIQDILKDCGISGLDRNTYQTFEDENKEDIITDKKDKSESDIKEKDEVPKVRSKESKGPSPVNSNESHQSEGKEENKSTNYEIGEYNGHPLLSFPEIKMNFGKAKWEKILEAYDAGVLNNYIEISEQYSKDKIEKELDSDDKAKWYVYYNNTGPALCIYTYNTYNTYKKEKKFSFMYKKAKFILENIDTIRKFCKKSS
ncbi:phospholipase D-like domain-containing protein [Methanoplanus limicola]|nr:phospholipase D-like domain-containing protein [Methanoplanus limicola]